MSQVAGIDDERLLGALRAALRDLSYGSVEIVVHDGRVVQIERREKFRLADIARAPSSRADRTAGGSPRTFQGERECESTAGMDRSSERRRPA